MLHVLFIYSQCYVFYSSIRNVMCLIHLLPYISVIFIADPVSVAVLFSFSNPSSGALFLHLCAHNIELETPKHTRNGKGTQWDVASISFQKALFI